MKALSITLLWIFGTCLVALLLTSCVGYRGGDGTTFVMVGTNAETVSAGGLMMSSVNQSDSVKHGTDAMTNVVRLKGWFGLGTTAVEEVGSAADQLIE